MFGLGGLSVCFWTWWIKCVFGLAAEADDLLSSTMDKDELPVHSLDELVEDLDDAGTDS